MAKRRNKGMDEQSDSAASQSDDENYDDGHKKNHKEIETEKRRSINYVRGDWHALTTYPPHRQIS